MYYAFVHNDTPVVVPAASCLVTIVDGKIHVNLLPRTWWWEDVVALQTIGNAQDCLAWLGIGVDTEGNSHAVPWKLPGHVHRQAQ